MILEFDQYLSKWTKLPVRYLHHTFIICYVNKQKKCFKLSLKVMFPGMCSVKLGDVLPRSRVKSIARCMKTSVKLCKSLLTLPGLFRRKVRPHATFWTDLNSGLIVRTLFTYHIMHNYKTPVHENPLSVSHLVSFINTNNKVIFVLHCRTIYRLAYL